jgi:uncharacterized protein (TIGR02145 family)
VVQTSQTLLSLWFGGVNWNGEKECFMSNQMIGSFLDLGVENTKRHCRRKAMFPMPLFLLVLVGALNLAYAAGQGDFYGVWISKEKRVYNKHFYEINKNAITGTYIDYNNNIEKKKYRIVKWEKSNDKRFSNTYTIYLLREDNSKASFQASIDAYSDLHIGTTFLTEMKKSSTTELNKAIKEATAAKAAAQKAEEAARKAKEAALEVAREAAAQKAAEAVVQLDSFSDQRDGKTYKTVKIDSQTWMAENLNYNANGSKCYKDDESNCQKYGRLYNWKIAKSGGVCPSDWRLPSKDEWQNLVDFAGGYEVAGTHLKAKEGWPENGNGTDGYGFSAMPGGYGGSDGKFVDIGNNAYWWSASKHEDYGDFAYYQGMNYDNAYAYWNRNYKSNLFSVRCIQIAVVKDSFCFFWVGKTYKTVKIDSQTWMAENLNYNANGSKCHKDDESNCKKYGRLYDWNTAKGTCPNGWHLPSKDEWQKLVDFAGGNKVAGIRLKAASGWDDYGNGTDDYGFSALPGGLGHVTSRINFNNVGYYGTWWSTSENEGYSLSANPWYMGYSSDGATWSDNLKSQLVSVRCVKD